MWQLCQITPQYLFAWMSIYISNYLGNQTLRTANLIFCLLPAGILTKKLISDPAFCLQPLYLTPRCFSSLLPYNICMQSSPFKHFTYPLLAPHPTPFWGAFLLTNLNLDSSIKNWIRLLTSWNIKSEGRSVFTRESLGRGYLETFGSCKTIKHVIDRLIKWNEQSKTSLTYQSE